MNWMQHALDLAKKGRSTCPPNPMVGCIIVKNNHIVGQGFHQITGGPHAEIIALHQAQEKAQDADVYLTLEPCSHYGWTPPCVEALVGARVKRVHIAIQDPNPLVSGRGMEILRQSGIEVILGDCQEEAYQLNQDFFHYITHKKPYVIAKWAMTLDGKIATSRGQSKWITSDQAREHAHGIRSHVCGIMVGANTARLDNPKLTVRSGEAPLKSIRQPRPIILTQSGDVPLDSEVFEAGRKTIVLTSDRAPVSFLRGLSDRRISYHILPLHKNKIEMAQVLSVLAEEHKMKNILVEGGSQLLTAFHHENLMNQIYAYVAPKIMGGNSGLTPIGGKDLENMNDMSQLHSQEFISLGPDLCVKAKTMRTPRHYGEFINV